MASRLELQDELEKLLGNRNVYYQPPESVKMEYPAIRYVKEGYDKKEADDTAYLLKKRYGITVIDRRPDNPVIEKLLEIPNSRYDRHYISDNLHHDVITLYF